MAFWACLLGVGGVASEEFSEAAAVVRLVGIGKTVANP